MNRSYVPVATQDETVPDGPRPEAWYRDLLASQTGGQIEAELLFGRADVLTDENVFEVEAALHWRTGVRQVLAYAAQAGRQAALAVYGKPSMAPAVLRYLQQLPSPGVDLWWFTGDAFARIASEGDAAAIPATAIVSDGPLTRHGAAPAVAAEHPEEKAAWGKDWHVVIEAAGPGKLSIHAADLVVTRTSGTLSLVTDANGWRLRHTGPAKGATAADAAASASAALVRAVWAHGGVKAEVTDVRALRWEDYVTERYPEGVPDWLAKEIAREEATRGQENS